MVTEAQMQQIVTRIVAGYQPDRIILFGSYAYGTPTADSDVDLLVIKAGDARGKHQRIRAVREAVLHLSESWVPAMDILVLNAEEERHVLQNRFLVEHKALKDGRQLYRRAA